MKRFFQMAVMTVALSGLGACAASRSVVEVGAAGAPPANPATGVAVKIDRVDDLRHFEASPPNPDTPSLSADDVGNAGLRARAIGRKRGGFGKALGDVLLPEGETVSGVVSDAVARGFREAGYRVLAPGDAGYAEAAPVALQIRQFWSWFSPGFFEVHVSNRSEVEIAGPLPPLANGLSVRAGASEGMQAVFESDWQKIAKEGLDNLVENTVHALKGEPQNLGAVASDAAKQ